MKFGTELPVGHDESADDSQAGCPAGLKERGRRGSEVCSENQSRRGPVRRQRVNESAGDLARVGFIRHAGLLRKRALFQPIQQAPSQAAEYSKLRKVDVRIDQAGQQKAAPQIGSHRARIRRAKRLKIAAGSDSAVADQQPAVPMTLHRAIVEKGIARSVKQGCPQ